MVAAPPFRWTREGFLLAVEAGAFGESTVELLDGEVYEIVSEGQPHRFATMLLQRALAQAFGETYIVRTEMGLPLGRSQPKPDVSVLRWDPEELRHRDEGAEDVVLVVEVVSSRPDTAEIKRSLYARAGVPEYWILDVAHRTLVTLQNPQDGTYGEVQTRLDGDQVVANGSVIAVRDLLP